MRGTQLVVIVALLSVLVSCTKPEEPKEAAFEVTDTQEQMWLDMHPQILITVKNVGDATGYSVRCEARAKDTNGVIIDSDDCYFVDGGDIRPGESAQDDVIFWDLSSHDDYATVEYQLSWGTRN